MSATPRVDDLITEADAEGWTEADLVAELEPLARTLERETVELANTVLALQAENEALRDELGLERAAFEVLRKDRDELERMYAALEETP